jgi:hypothetical protein
MGGWNKNTKSLPIFNDATVPFKIIVGIIGTKLRKSVAKDLHLLRVGASITNCSRTDVERPEKIIFHHEQGRQLDRKASDKTMVGAWSGPREKFTGRVMEDAFHLVEVKSSMSPGVALHDSQLI